MQSTLLKALLAAAVAAALMPAQAAQEKVNTTIAWPATARWGISTNPALIKT